MSNSKTNKAKNGCQTKLVAQAATVGEGQVKVSSPRRLSKLLTIISMLRRPDGATIEDLVAATGWQPNSIRGAISGAIRKRRLMKVVSEVTNGVRAYRITN